MTYEEALALLRTEHDTYAHDRIGDGGEEREDADREFEEAVRVLSLPGGVGEGWIECTVPLIQDQHVVPHDGEVLELLTFGDGEVMSRHWTRSDS